MTNQARKPPCYRRVTPCYSVLLLVTGMIHLTIQSRYSVLRACYSELQRVTRALRACYNVLQLVTACYSVIRRVTGVLHPVTNVGTGALPRVTWCYTLLQACYTVLQRITACYGHDAVALQRATGVLQRVTACYSRVTGVS